MDHQVGDVLVGRGHIAEGWYRVRRRAQRVTDNGDRMANRPNRDTQSGRDAAVRKQVADLDNPISVGILVAPRVEAHSNEGLLHLND